MRKTNHLLIAWIFATRSPGNLRIFASRAGATSAKWVLNVDAIVEDSVIVSSFTLSFSRGFDWLGWSRLLIRRQVVFVSEAVSDRL